MCIKNLNYWNDYYSLLETLVSAMEKVLSKERMTGVHKSYFLLRLSDEVYKYLNQERNKTLMKDCSLSSNKKQHQKT